MQKISYMVNLAREPKSLLLNFLWNNVKLNLKYASSENCIKSFFTSELN